MKSGLCIVANAIIWGAAAGVFGLWVLIPVAAAYFVGVFQGSSA
jgi:hypothetical protein